MLFELILSYSTAIYRVILACSDVNAVTIFATIDVDSTVMSISSVLDLHIGKTALWQS